MSYEKNTFAEYLTDQDKEAYTREENRIEQMLRERYIELTIPEDVQTELTGFRDHIAAKLNTYGYRVESTMRK